MGNGGGSAHGTDQYPLKSTLPVSTGAVYFAGHWRIKRIIRDHRTAHHHLFTGRAEFTSVSGSNGRSEYSEEGVLVLDNGLIRMKRRSFYDWTDATHAQVRFEDGRLFHELDLGTGSWRVVHECGMDRYDGRYEIHGPQTWDLTWRVTGPDKDYEMLTCYQRRRRTGNAP